MFPELLLGSVLASAGGMYGYLYYDHQRTKRARQAEEKARNAQFRDALVRELRKTKVSEFQFSEFADQCGVNVDVAEGVANDIYKELTKKVFEDGVLTPEERRKLDKLAAALEIPPQRTNWIEAEVKSETYHRAVVDVLADGVVTSEEAAELKALRRSLGISRDEGSAIAEGLSREAYTSFLERIVREGRISSQDRSSLCQMKEALAASGTDSLPILRQDAISLYRECLAGILQQGEVTHEQEALLGWLQGETGLSHDDIRTDLGVLEQVKRLAAYRRGELPVISTSKILEGGEICHYQGRCGFEYRTATRTIFASGELLVTSNKIIFTSPTKSFSLSPSKILDISITKDFLEIQSETRQGTGTYHVGNAATLEAIIFGVVRKHKYLLAENYSSARNRHIPDEIKRAVWHRDGGRCVKCSSAIYLEFDHIIPFSKGGANSEGNIQLLCRACNLAKSNRI